MNAHEPWYRDWFYWWEIVFVISLIGALVSMVMEKNG